MSPMGPDGGRKKPTGEEILQRIGELSTLPQIAVQVIKVAGDPDSDAADLKQVVEGDAALSARILRCVNSAAFATRTEIANLQQAIAYLGLRRIRNLAITAGVSQLFRKDETIGPYRRSNLWRHLVSVGICARMIALGRRINNFEEAFLAGLLHDVGIIFEDQCAHDLFSEVIRSLDESKTLPENERSYLGFDHTTLGERIAQVWGFPESVRAAIRYHHMSADYAGDEIQVVRCVEVANVLCTLKGIWSVGLKLVKLSQPALAGLSLAREDISVLAEDLQHELTQNASLFQM